MIDIEVDLTLNHIQYQDPVRHWLYMRDRHMDSVEMFQTYSSLYRLYRIDRIDRIDRK